MGAKLQALLDLQEIELQIVDIRRQLERKERLVTAQDAKVRQFNTSLEGERGEVRKLEVRFQEMDVDVKARSGHITKLREQLNSVKTNKEYHAIIQQINTEGADMKRVEASALELMQKVDDAKKGLGEHQAGEKDEVARLETLRADLAQMKQSFAARLDSLQKRRDAAAAQLERSVVDQFTRLSERFEGEAMAELVRPNPRRDEFVCGGCNMSTRADLANALKTRDDVLPCKNCGRILYLRREA